MRGEGVYLVKGEGEEVMDEAPVGRKLVLL